MQLRHKLLLAWVVMGFASMIGQILLLRELVSIFYGNELALGMTLASWLLWVGIGSFVLGRFADRIGDQLRALSLCYVLTAMMLPLSLIGVRSVKLLLGVAPGEIVGVFPMLYSSFVLLPPLCLTLGFSFALNCTVLGFTPKDAVQGIGRVYVFEAIGSAVAGIGFSYVLVRSFTHLQTAFLVSLLAAGIAYLLAPGKRKILRVAALALSLAVLGALISGVTDTLDTWSNSLRWKGFDPVHCEDSIYGNLTVTRHGKQVSMFESGLLMFTYPDLFAAEEAVHYSMLSHPKPERILLIGGGTGGALEEILKYDVKRVDYVELDPLVVKLSQKYIDSEAVDDPRVRIFNVDGRFWVKRTEELYDVVIVDLPEPFTTQLNRFFTREFYQEIAGILAPGGLLSFRVTSHENYISQELAQFLSSIRETLKKVFAEVQMIPGDTNIFLAATREGMLSLRPSFFQERLRERDVETKYVRAYYVNSRLSAERVDYLSRRVQEAGSARINRDFHPISYYYDIVLWSTHFHSAERSLLSAISGLKLWHILLGLLLLTFLLSVTFSRVKSAPVLFAVGTTGSAEIVMEVMALLAFQSLYGFVYYKVGMILTAFMVGLTLGAFYMTRRLETYDLSIHTFLKIQVLVCAYPLVLLLAFGGLWLITGWRYSMVSVEFGFPVLTASAGFVGGLQFPLASKLYLQKGKEVGRVAGATYGIDLFGACGGALVSSAFLIPILGIPNTCFVVAALNGVALILILQGARDTTQS